jgi:hypothetical protein
METGREEGGNEHGVSGRVGFARAGRTYMGWQFLHKYFELLGTIGSFTIREAEKAREAGPDQLRRS